MQGNNGFQNNSQLPSSGYNGQPWQNNIPLQVFTTEIGSEFVEQIKRDGIEEYKAKQNRHPSYSGRQLLADYKNSCMVLQTVVKGETKDCIQFCTGVFEGVTKCNYERWYPFPANYLVEIVLPGEKEVKEIVISESAWGKKEMLHILNDSGVSFFIRQSDSQILRILMDYLAIFFVNQAVGVVEPRAGWYKRGGNWRYMFAERWEIKEILSYAVHKSIGADIEESADQYLGICAEWLQGVASEGLRGILTGIILFALNASRIYQELSCWQERAIMIRCSDEKVKRWIKGFLCFFTEDAAKTLNLACTVKELRDELMAARDQVIVIDGDAADVSGRRKRNVSMIQDYVVNGILTADMMAQSLVIIITKGIVEDFPMDEAIIFDVKSSDFTKGCLEDKQVQRISAYLALGFILRIEENPERFIHWIKGHAKDCETMSERLAIIAEAGCNMVGDVVKPKGFIFDFNSCRETLRQAEEWMDVAGLGTRVLEVIVQLLMDGSLKVKSRNEPIEAEWLEDVVFWNKREVFVTQNAVRKWVLPRAASIDTALLTLIKALYDEGYLRCYDSDSCRNNYQKRLLLYDKAGKRYSPWAVAIPSAHFDEIKNDVLEEAQYGE